MAISEAVGGWFSRRCAKQRCIDFWDSGLTHFGVKPLSDGPESAGPIQETFEHVGYELLLAARQF